MRGPRFVYVSPVYSLTIAPPIIKTQTKYVTIEHTAPDIDEYISRKTWVLFNIPTCLDPVI